jgi:hypothetical protein
MKRNHVDVQPAPIGAKTATHLRLVRGDELPSATEQPYVRGMAGAGLDRVSTTIEALIALPHDSAQRGHASRSGRGGSR